ncbi:MAG: sugar ABC transporter permease [Candidatus Izemoplasma sp.]|nr:sugar ABC transporter permease [Candidatus Izemoplasma sp.]
MKEKRQNIGQKILEKGLIPIFRIIVLILVVIVYTIVQSIHYIAKFIMYVIGWIGAKIKGKDYVGGADEIALRNEIVKEDVTHGKVYKFFENIFPDTTTWVNTVFTGRGDRAQNNRVFTFFLAPALGSFILMVIVPFFWGIYFSLTDFGGIGSADYVGLKNYQGILSEPRFYYSFYRTVLYAFLNIILINLVAFGLALLVTQKVKIKNFARAGFFLPNLIGGLVLGFIFQFIFAQVFVALGPYIPYFEKSFISDGATKSMIAILIVVTWQYSGYIMMIYVAALQNVPKQLIEASEIDGASPIQRLRHITLPLVAQAFTVAMFLTLVTSFKQFDTIFSMTGGGPTGKLPEFLQNIFNVSPISVRSLNLLAVNIYNEAFAFKNFGLGQAKAILFFVILLVISLLQVYYNKKREVEL